MQQVLPIIIICGVGLSVCFVLLLIILIRCLQRRFRKKREVFEMDERTLTVKLDKKDLRKR